MNLTNRQKKWLLKYKEKHIVLSLSLVLQINALYKKIIFILFFIKILIKNVKKNKKTKLTCIKWGRKFWVTRLASPLKRKDPGNFFFHASLQCAKWENLIDDIHYKIFHKTSFSEKGKKYKIFQISSFNKKFLNRIKQQIWIISEK